MFKQVQPFPVHTMKVTSNQCHQAVNMMSNRLWKSPLMIDPSLPFIV